MTVAGEPVRLTANEFRFLGLLVGSDGRLVTQRQAAEHLDTGSGPPDPGTLRVYVAQLRKKLGDDAADPRLILTYFGLGYRWIGGDRRRLTPTSGPPVSGAPPVTAAISNHTVLPTPSGAGAQPQSSESASTISSPRPDGSTGSGVRISGLPGPASDTATRIRSGPRSMSSVKPAAAWRTLFVASSDTSSATVSTTAGGAPSSASAT